MRILLSEANSSLVLLAALVEIAENAGLKTDGRKRRFFQVFVVFTAIAA